MLPHRFYFIGLQLLVLTYTVQSFVLLTANMEDIKKLARKFVSDSLADKIAEFVVQATETMAQQTTNVSEENDLNQDISDDNYDRNIARQRIKNTESTTEYNEYKYQPRTTPSSNIPRDTNRIEANLKYWQQQRNELARYKSSPEERNKYNNKYSQIKEKKQIYRPDKSRERNFKEHKKYKDSGASKYAKRRPSSSKYKTTEKRGLVKLSAVDSLESNEGKSNYDRQTIEKQTETTRFRGLRAISRVETTTMKQKTDFDQYDNPKYPRAEYIATSGPVMLPRIPNIKEKQKYRLNSLSSTNAIQKQPWF